MNVMDKIKLWFRPKLPEGEQYLDFTPEFKLYQTMARKCPECHKPANWMEGPQGGACINIFCGFCGQGYSITPMIGIAEKIHKDERYIQGRKI